MVKRTGVVGHKSRSTKRLVVESLSDIETSNFKALLTCHFLTKVRVTEAPPFTITRDDFTGALYVKGPVSGENKVYIYLLMYAVTRVVHLEVVSDLTIDTFY